MSIRDCSKILSYGFIKDNEKVCPIVRKIVLNEGKPLTEDEKVEFDEYLAELREWNDNMYITFQMALGKFFYQSVKVKEIGAYYTLYRKELAKVLTPEQVLFLQE